MITTTQDSTDDESMIEDRVNAPPSVSHSVVSPSLHVAAPTIASSPQGILPKQNQNNTPMSVETHIIDLTSLDGESLRSDDFELDGKPLDSILPDQTPSQALISPAMKLLSQQVKSPRIFLDICAGSTRPLSRALIALHADVISFDILLDHQMDLLADPSYEALLKLCASGSVAHGAA